MAAEADLLYAGFRKPVAMVVVGDKKKRAFLAGYQPAVHSVTGHALPLGHGQS